MMELILSTLELSLIFLKYSVPGLIVGVFVAEILIEFGIIGKMSFIGNIFIKLANLPEECGIAITTAFIDPRTANIMLADFYRNGAIDKKELYIASLIDAFPAMLRHWDSVLPVLLATLGNWGLIYFFILVLIGLLQTLFFALLGKALIKRNTKASNKKKQNIKVNYKHALKNALKKTIKNSSQILKTMIIASILTSFLIEIGIFDYLTNFIKNYIGFLPFSTEELTISITSMINAIASYTMAGAMLKEGTIDAFRAIRALLFGSILSSITMIRWLIPYYVGIYGFKDGTNLMLISTLARVFITILFVALISIFVG